MMKLMLCLLLLGSMTAISAETVQKPNIVFVLMDDLDTVISKPFYKKVLPETMKLKEEEGVEFENTFVTTPLCCPSRAAILSGKYAHNTNVFNNGSKNGGRWQFKDDEPSALPAHLYRNGYETVIIGKYMNGFGAKKKDMEENRLPEPPYGWSQGHVFVSKNLKKYKGYNYHVLNWENGSPASDSDWQSPNKYSTWHGEEEKDYSTDYVKNRMLKFLKERKDKKKPFFAYLNPTCPHFPIPPAKRHLKKTAENWGPETFPTNRPNYFNATGKGEKQKIGAVPKDSPEWLRASWKKRLRLLKRGGRALVFFGAEEPPEKKDWNYNYVDWYNRMGSLYACDDLVKDVVAQLKKSGQWDNTILVFTSDNGYNLGAHALAQKLTPYEESLRVPLFIAGGKNINLKKGTVKDNWALNIDLAPTLIDMAGIKVPEDMDGRPLTSLVKKDREEPKDWRESFLIEYIGPGIANGYLPHFATYHFRLAPAMFLDVPTYNAVRTKKNGKEYLYVEWNQWRSNRLARRRLSRGKKILFGKKRKMKNINKKDYELFDITNDPYQLENLVYHEKEKNESLMQEFDQEIKRFKACSGQECHK